MDKKIVSDILNCIEVGRVCMGALPCIHTHVYPPNTKFIYYMMGMYMILREGLDENMHPGMACNRAIKSHNVT